jgi:toxin ParE1/3/4
MGRIQRTSDALDDLSGIWHYIAEHNQTAADRLIDRLEHSLRLLSRFPLMGESVDHLRPGVRRFTEGNYQLFYEPTRDGIVLLRVYHAARSLDGLFDEP